MAYYSDKLGVVRDFANLSKDGQQKVINTSQKEGFSKALDVLSNLSQAARATVLAVEGELGADGPKAAKEVEKRLAGQPNDFDKLPIEVKVQIIEIASANGVRIP